MIKQNVTKATVQDPGPQAIAISLPEAADENAAPEAPAAAPNPPKEEPKAPAPAAQAPVAKADAEPTPKKSRRGKVANGIIFFVVAGLAIWTVGFVINSFTPTGKTAPKPAEAAAPDYFSEPKPITAPKTQRAAPVAAKPATAPAVKPPAVPPHREGEPNGQTVDPRQLIEAQKQIEQLSIRVDHLERVVIKLLDKQQAPANPPAN